MINNVTIKRWGWLAKQLNEIIDVLNALTNLTTTNPSGGSLKISKANAILDLGLTAIQLELCDGTKIEVYGKKLS